ncbi:hypothetical protein PIROE2DRAFT_17829 [Piromyces sp. E2]|nr:hypothetical protein PIROE2DRAFT_17829 [Piromyces sp. E2]|eukprot:OUM57248.1 hypothetical protein PIROE2DRAFT_17829 [Piromyces sp. E2]
MDNTTNKINDPYYTKLKLLVECNNLSQLLQLYDETINSFKLVIISMLLNEYNEYYINKAVNEGNNDSIKYENK